ncbi:OmpA/MotB family protein [Gaopeijia maritima]|uniref:Flagellar motor protein MotB n=1 Tax=Gaopeijia maritima TaxID=3119007 RepID=A0ABU9E573_9BACT
MSEETEAVLPPPPDDDDDRPKELVEEGAPLWTTTFGDLMSLLLTFFILLYSMSEIKQDKFLQASQSLREAIGGTAEDVPEDPMALVDEELDPEMYLESMDAGEVMIESVAAAYMEVIARRLEKFIEENDLQNEFSVEREEDGVYLRMQSSALFASGSGVLEEKAVRMLGLLSEITSSIDVGAVVSGHADNQPISTAQFASNWELSAARAAGVARHLVESGQAPDMVRVESFGEYKPVTTNDTPEGRAQNRRVDVFFSKIDILDAVRRWAAEGEDVPELRDQEEDGD